MSRMQGWRRQRVNLSCDALAETSTGGIVMAVENHPGDRDARPVLVLLEASVQLTEGAAELRRLARELDRLASQEHLADLVANANPPLTHKPTP